MRYTLGCLGQMIRIFGLMLIIPAIFGLILSEQYKNWVIYKRYESGEFDMYLLGADFIVYILIKVFLLAAVVYTVYQCLKPICDLLMNRRLAVILAAVTAVGLITWDVVKSNIRRNSTPEQFYILATSYDQIENGSVKDRLFLYITDRYIYDCKWLEIKTEKDLEDWFKREKITFNLREELGMPDLDFNNRDNQNCITENNENTQ